MYVSRPLSLYKTNPDALFAPSPEGPNGGYLVLQDEASTPTHFFGLIKGRRIKDFPFPQNKLHVVTHGSGEHETHHPIYFIPVINRPLSSNTYYAIKSKGRNKGNACKCSTDEDMVTCCLGNCVNDVEPRLLDPTNIYQEFKMSLHTSWQSSGFRATSIAVDGHPPSFLRRKGWHLMSKTPKNFSLREAAGIDTTLRARLPDFNFPLSNPVVVGKWYCPFMFIKDVLTPREQVKKSMFYQMTLEQQWEQIFTTSSSQGNNTVLVDITLPTESVTVAEKDAYQENGGNTVVWFNSNDGGARVGLSKLVVERMLWEEERAGWVPKEYKQDKVLKIEEFEGVGKWRSYECYMLVERFVLRRMDGTVVLTYSFNYKNQIRSKWD